MHSKNALPKTLPSLTLLRSAKTNKYENYKTVRIKHMIKLSYL